MAKVSLLLGSANDRPLVKESKLFDVFERVGVEVEMHVVSAHRNAEELHRFCASADPSTVFIAAAALATALPGAVAGAMGMRSVVIGVPLDDYGIESCIRMPPGVPVLTAGVGKAGLHNAAIAACQVLAVNDPVVARELAGHLEESARKTRFNVDLED